jgi:hypothetical protein
LSRPATHLLAGDSKSHAAPSRISADMDVPDRRHRVPLHDREHYKGPLTVADDLIHLDL